MGFGRQRRVPDPHTAVPLSARLAKPTGTVGMCTLARWNHEREKKNHARVLIVTTQAVREALAIRISRQPDLEVCREAADMTEALHLVAEAQSDEHVHGRRWGVS
jgi:hypothetical protein